jgi:molecular chaperone GrpE (heat shock protein)
MNIQEIERKLIDLDKNLHSILEMVREVKKPEEDVVESVAGAWGYDVDSVEFVRELRRTERV